MINVASIISDDSEMSGSTSVAPLHTLTPSRRERFENSELFKIALLRSHISGGVPGYRRGTRGPATPRVLLQLYYTRPYTQHGTAVYVYIHSSQADFRAVQ